MKYKTKLFSVFLIALLFTFIFPILVLAATNLEYTLLESIPGFAAAGASPSFNEYVGYIYQFSIWIVGICALLMISIGAFMYITSAGNNAAMSSAKKIIADAIIGLALALLAYLLLHTINPELIKPKGISSSSSSSLASAASGGTSGTLNGIPTQVANQNDDASATLLATLNCMWSKKPTGSSFTISSISDNNCGATGYSGEKADWPQCATEGQSNCCYHKKNSCHYGGTTCQGKSYAADISTSSSSLSSSEIMKLAEGCGGTAINEGNHIHFSVGNCNCT